MSRFVSSSTLVCVLSLAFCVVAPQSVAADIVTENLPGQQIALSVTAGSQTPGSRAVNVVNNAGMSGTEGTIQSHDSNSAGADMWLTMNNPGAKNWIQFDLHRVYPLGQLWIWNYNQSDSNSPTKRYWYRGLKKLRIFTSVDGKAWREFRGRGYPFEFARANGAAALTATNLNDGHHSPIDFNGLSARYVKFIPYQKAGVGNWGGINGKENAFGLSQIRLYSYSHDVEISGLIPATVSAASSNQAEAFNLVNNYGMSGTQSARDTHDNQASGNDMWLSGAASRTENAVELDFGGTYPIGKMYVWNYNKKGSSGGHTPNWQYGMKNVKIYYSIDNSNWTELKGTGYPYELAAANGSSNLAATNLNDAGHPPVDFGGVEARYVKIVANGDAGSGNWVGTPSMSVGASTARPGILGFARRNKQLASSHFGLSAVRFYAAPGWAAEPAYAWDGLFSRYVGWTGADGIFSIPLNGTSAQESPTTEQKTLFLFGDTFIGAVDPVTKVRLAASVANNTLAIMSGMSPNPAAIQFIWGETPQGLPRSVFAPTTDSSSSPASPSATGKLAWYWLQDGVTANGNLFLLPLQMESDPNGPPGFQFKVTAVKMISVAIHNGELDIKHVRQMNTDLFYHPTDNSGDISYGAGIMSNTADFGAPNPDGYIYVYGYKNAAGASKQLVVARVLPGDIGDLSKWRFWNGASWADNIAQSAPVLGDVSTELSVTPIRSGKYQGKYLAVFEKHVMNNLIEASISDTPYGPFETPIPLYYTSEGNMGQSVFTYNAKAHPSLSRTGELLISYNVNSTDFSANNSNADIYRPRWITVRMLH